MWIMLWASVAFECNDKHVSKQVFFLLSFCLWLFAPGAAFTTLNFPPKVRTGQ
jgi:hypothetical protein